MESLRDIGINLDKVKNVSVNIDKSIKRKKEESSNVMQTELSWFKNRLKTDAVSEELEKRSEEMEANLRKGSGFSTDVFKKELDQILNIEDKDKNF